MNNVLVKADYCFDKETEVLTNRGWIKFPHLKAYDLVAQWF
jgi:hypothetical protein